jgi:predicted transcriptional regulator
MTHPTHRSYSRRDVERLVTMYDEGVSLHSIARLLCRSYRSVQVKLVQLRRDGLVDRRQRPRHADGRFRGETLRSVSLGDFRSS